MKFEQFIVVTTVLIFVVSVAFRDDAE